MASIRLSDDCLMDNMRLKGTDGMFEVTKDELEISSFVASHYSNSKNLTVVYTEADRDSLLALPARELSFLATALSCDIDSVVETLLPKKFRAKKSKSTKKEEVLEDE